MKSQAFTRADRLLAEIAHLKRVRANVEREAQAEIEQVKARWHPHINYAGIKLQEAEAKLKALAKAHRAELFDGRDRVDLEHGALLFGVSQRVKRAKAVTVEALKALGQIGRAAVRVVESVDWDALEKWPDERLIEIGTERVRREAFAYELKEDVARASSP